MQMQLPTTSLEAMNFWAVEACRLKEMKAGLDGLLPKTDDGERPVSEETFKDVEDALANFLLAAQTCLGGYSQMVYAEKAEAQRLQQQQLNTTYQQQPTQWR